MDLATRIFRQQDGVLVIGYRSRSADHVRSEASCKGDDLRGVAVVDLQHGRPALRLDAELLPHRAFSPFIDSLYIVVDDHQRLGARVYHLGRQRKPLRLEVVGLVDQDSVVLLRRDMPLIDSFHDLRNAGSQPFFVVGILSLGWGGNPIGPKHPVTP